MKNYRKIICEICGKEDEVPNTRRLDYCNNPECGDKMRIKKRKETMERFNAKNKIVEQDEYIVRTSLPVERSVDSTAGDTMDISDIRELARQLGSIRFSLIQLIEKERAKIDTVNKGDDILIHSFEFDNLTKEEVWEKYLETKKRRISRRQEKYRYTIIKGLLDSIKIKNPDKYIVQSINGCKTTRDFDKYIEEMKKDRDIFIV